MRIRPGKYDFTMIGVAFAVCAYVLSWISQNPFWGFMIHLGRQARLSFNNIETIFGVMYLILTAVSVVSVASHLCVLLSASLRARFKPALPSHIACLVLLWIAFGEVVTVCSKPFPYLH